MASWAAIAKAAPPPAAPAAPVVESQPGLRMAVVDANAIISGVRMEGLADRLVTIEEVLSEVRDKQSRQFLATFPFPIETKEPTPESVAAGTGFGALLCGDRACTDSAGTRRADAAVIFSRLPQ